MYVQGIANFLDDLLGGVGLIALALLLGSLLWGLVALRALRESPGVPDGVLATCVMWLRRGAVAVAAVQAMKLATKGVVLASSLGEMPWFEYLGTVQVRAGIARLIVAIVVGVLTTRLAANPRRRDSWLAVSLASAVLIVVGAWLVHAVGRLEDRGLLMAITALHELVAAVWVGGALQLVFLWRAGRRDGAVKEFFPVAVTRFAPLGMVTVAFLVVSGAGLALKYVGSLAGIPGTAYGSLVAAKVVLLLIALGFAAMNFSAGRDWLRSRQPGGGVSRVPFYLEAETLFLIALLFVAATVSSQPPAVDIPDRTATTSEVLGMFAPRAPSFSSPTHEALLAGEAGRLAVVDRVPSAAATDWSDYNHNVAGMFLLVMGLVGLLSYLPGISWARWWPAGFLLLAAFLFFRSDAESWPLGPIGFWASTFGNGEVLQHRLATLLAFALGAVELRARLMQARDNAAAFLFPALCALGGILLVTHAHLPFEIRSDYLIQSTHLVMGLCAIVMASSRWLELRLVVAGNPAASRVFGLLSITAMLFVSYILIVYKEPLY